MARHAEIRKAQAIIDRATETFMRDVYHRATGPVVRNSIVVDNGGFGGAQGADNQISPGLDVGHSIVEGGYPGAGNLDVDPRFQAAAFGDFNLAIGSPAIDAADGTALPATLVIDAANRRRIIDDPSTPNTGPGGPPVDIGAFEFTDAVSTVVETCIAQLNSTGVTGKTDAIGSNLVADNFLRLSAYDLPPNSFGYFVISQTAGYVVAPGGSLGALCVSGVIGRMDDPGQVLNSGAAGRIDVVADIQDFPTPIGPVQVLPGDTWYFQLWHRDSVGGQPRSNFSDSARVTFE